MKKVLIIADIPGWAIGKLSQSIVNNNRDMNIELIYVHPRDAAEQKSIDLVRDKMIDADVVHFQYWNTAQQLIKSIPELREKKLILTHHNQKNILSEDWNLLGIQQHICHTQKAKKILNDAGYDKVQVIQHGIDLRFFEFMDKLPDIDQKFGYVGRVVPWKGLKEVAQAAREIGFPLLLMGKYDKADYWESIPVGDRANIETNFMDCTDSERIEGYYSMNVYVGNSGDGREEGTLGLLEAMACGVPVVTTPSGEAADICIDGVNALVVPFNDPVALKNAMKRLIYDVDLANELRSHAWETVKQMTEKKMAYEYRLAYKKLYYGKDNPLVSVIIPYTKDREEYVKKICEVYENQSYKNIELILALDDEPGYNLAKVRNIAAINADGDILIFNDSRILPEPDAIGALIKRFIKEPDAKVWYFGNKGGKKTFVENFSAISRKYFIRGGMCNERITRYGAMSQELRVRFGFAGIKFKFCEDVKASALCSSHKTKERRQDVIESKFLLFKMGLNKK